jgi:predicted MFS family arabinose efflux permease
VVKVARSFGHAQIGFMLGGALLGLMLLKGFSWQHLFWVVSTAAVLQAGLLYALVPAESPYSLSPTTDSSDDSQVPAIEN